MQQKEEKIKRFKKVVGEILADSIKSNNKSIRKFAHEYDFDRGNLSKIIRGELSCGLITAWRLAEASGMDFVDFAQKLSNKLGSDFSLVDE